MGNVALNTVQAGDGIAGMSALETESAHLILSDIPYGIGADDWDVLHDNNNSALLGSSPAQRKAGNVFKKRGKPINGWSQADRKIPHEYYEWCSSWVPEWYRVLKPGGSAIVFAGRRFSHRCICAFEDSGFSFRDMISWLRSRAPHRAQRVSVVFERRENFDAAEQWQGWRVGNLRPTFEPVLWFCKPYKIGTTIADNVEAHGVGAFNQSAFSSYVENSENVISCAFAKNESGLHPTQKPLSLMSAFIELTTTKGQTVVDPFCGSGTTLVAAKRLQRNFIGFERDSHYHQVAKARLEERTLFT